MALSLEDLCYLTYGVSHLVWGLVMFPDDGFVQIMGVET